VPGARSSGQHQLDDAAPVFVGAFAVLPSQGGILTHPTTLNYQLALKELASTGIPTGPGVGRRTPVAIECNVDGTSPPSTEP